MSLDARTIALRGLGLAPLARAMLGLIDMTVAPPLPVLGGGGGGAWASMYAPSHRFSQSSLTRSRRAREADLLLLHRL